MYSVQTEPDEEAILKNGVMIHPLITLKDGHGGISHIYKDDGCFVLANRTGSHFSPSYYWYIEAALALHVYLLRLTRES